MLDWKSSTGQQNDSVAEQPPIVLTRVLRRFQSSPVITCANSSNKVEWLHLVYERGMDWADMDRDICGMSPSTSDIGLEGATVMRISSG